jgi:C1A family cysteine protease
MSDDTVPGLGWLPDIPSVRDFTEDHPKVASMLLKTQVATIRPSATTLSASQSGSSAAAATAPALTAQIDLRAHFSPIEDQGQLGSCTANAACGLVEYFQRRATGKHIDASRLFVYKTSRNLLGWTGDTGAYLRTAMGSLVLFGAPPERYWPYDGRSPASNTRFDVEPPAFCYAFGANFQAITYFRLDPPTSSATTVLSTIKQYLAAGFPSMFGFPVYQEFMTPTTQADIAYPKTNSKYYGGHAIIAAGYDDNRMIGADKGALLIRNSWGTGWGAGGYAWMSYKYVTQGLATDWWSLISNEWVDTGQF